MPRICGRVVEFDLLAFSFFALRDRGFVCLEGKFAFLALTRLFEMVMMENAGAKRVREGFMTSGEQSKYERPAIVALRPPLLPRSFLPTAAQLGPNPIVPTPPIYTYTLPQWLSHSSSWVPFWSPSNLHLSNLT